MSVSVGVCFVVSLTVDIILIFISAVSVVEFDEIRTTKKSPVEQCEFLNPMVRVGWAVGGAHALYHFVGFARVQPPCGDLSHLLVCS